MIKQIPRNNVLTTPFNVSKHWELYNIDNDDLVEIEPISASHTTNPERIPVALDYIDYSGNPLLNRDCNIALEQQTTDLVNYQEAEKRFGIFYSGSESRNLDGTFKRLVYSQIERAFYNTYRNPIQIFGMENIDFPLSQTYRHISDFFRMYNIPKTIMGDRLVEGTIQLYDTSLDDNVEIHDDSNGNLIATRNLFSRVQEVRKLNNITFSGISSYECPSAIVFPPRVAPIIESYQIGFFLQAFVSWSYTGSVNDTFILEKSIDSGSTFTDKIPISTGSFQYIDNDVMYAQTYWYRVAAYNVIGQSPYSNISTASIVTSSVPVNLCDPAFNPSLLSGNITTSSLAVYNNTHGVQIPINNLKTSSYSFWQTSNNFDGFLTLVDPLGSVIGTSSFSAWTPNSVGYFNNALTSVLDKSGSYTLEVSTVDNTGSFQVQTSAGGTLINSSTGRVGSHLAFATSSHVLAIGALAWAFRFLDITNNTIVNSLTTPTIRTGGGVVYSQPQDRFYGVYQDLSFVWKIGEFDNTGSLLNNYGIGALSGSTGLKITYDSDHDRIMIFDWFFSESVIMIWDIGTKSSTASLDLSPYTAVGFEGLSSCVYSNINKTYYFSQHLIPSNPASMISVNSETLAIGNTFTTTMDTIQYVSESSFIITSGKTSNDSVGFMDPVLDIVLFSTSSWGFANTWRDVIYNPCSNCYLFTFHFGYGGATDFMSGIAMVDANVFEPINFIPLSFYGNYNFETLLYEPSNSIVYCQQGSSINPVDTAQIYAIKASGLTSSITIPPVATGSLLPPLPFIWEP